MLGHLNAEEIEGLLYKTFLGRIGCADGKYIYIVPISYVYDGKYVYCHTQEGLKVALLRKNPMTCFEVEHLANMANWETVIAHGIFEELTDPILRQEALFKLYERKLPIITSQTTRLTEEWPFASESLHSIEGVTFRILLTEKTGRFEKS